MKYAKNCAWKAMQNKYMGKKIKVVESFSGIGSQAKALRNIEANFNVVATIDWDIYATCAYDLIHNGAPDLKPYKDFRKEDLIGILKRYTLSGNGKDPLSEYGLKSMSEESLRMILAAITRTRNLGSIVDVSGKRFPDKVDLFTYSFPCQDLSICGAWHGNKSGIDRNAHNRSGMLWEVERILKELQKINKPLPKFLLMENVSNILSDTHKKNFEEWKNYLENIGYYNHVCSLSAMNFGIPQTRVRTFMLSVFVGESGKKKEEVKKFFDENPLENKKFAKLKSLKKFLRVDYSNPVYKAEADASNPNDTVSRMEIYNENVHIYDGDKIFKKFIKTITTKQDRNPNSGVIVYKQRKKGKAPYRNLTPRECFMLMGFDEADFDNIVKYNFNARKGRKFFTQEKLIRLAGNSIVVKVLEEIFKQILEINSKIL